MKLFVVGSARSGTTLMSRILGKHPEVFSFQELHFFEEIWSPSKEAAPDQDELRRMTQVLMKNQYEHYVRRVDPGRFRSQADAFLTEQPALASGLELFEAFLTWETARHGRSIACTQTPRNVYYLDEILTAYPDAHVVWMVRDPRAVLCSQKYRWRRRWSWARRPDRYDALQAWINYHPITYSLIWRAALRAGEAHWDHERVHRIRFEDLIREPEGVLRALMGKLGLAYSPALLQVPQRDSSLRQDREDQLGIDPEAGDRWRGGCLDRAEIYLCERLARSRMVAHAYAPDSVGPSWPRLLLHLSTWLPKSGLAFLMNRRRTRSSLLSLKRRLGGLR